MRYAFHFDSAACSGCKACQVACKDRNRLPLGVLWRRVYEVSGGGWRRAGNAWVSDVFAYNLSLACNHCERPICAEVCPTGAMRAGTDGIVLIDGAKCIGCRYCEWACPYGAPQYDATAGRMTKCTACAEDVASGGLPACVAACGLRALDFGEAEEVRRKYPDAVGETWPLPAATLTGPALFIAPHAAAHSAGSKDARIANAEEIHPPAAPAAGERPLVAFTLLAQVAVGLYWAALATSPLHPPPLAAPVAATLLMLAAALASLLHLGTPRNAWRALGNLRTSWLSREILGTLLFGGGCAATSLLLLAGRTPPAELGLATGAAGLALLYAMARVYRLPTVPRWNSAATLFEFAGTGVVLGFLAYAVLLASSIGEGRVATLQGIVLAALAAAALRMRLRFYQRVLNAPAGPLRALPAAGAAPAAS